MRVKCNKRGYTIYLTDGEMEVLREMVALAESSDGVLYRRLQSDARRSYSRRSGKGQTKDFLRVDVNRRREEK